MAILDSSSAIASTPELIATHDLDLPQPLQSPPIVPDTARKPNLETEIGNGNPKSGSANGTPNSENGNGIPNIQKPGGHSNLENGNSNPRFENGNGEHNHGHGNGNGNGNGVLNSSSFSSSSSSEGANDQSAFHGSSMREIEDLFSKLNPHAKEFVPPSLLDGSLDMNAKKGGTNANRKVSCCVLPNLPPMLAPFFRFCVKD
jgi:hypothetical protein